MRGLGPRHREARQLGAGDETVDELGPADLVLVRGAEVRAEPDLDTDGLDHGRMAVAEEEGAVAHPVIDVLVAVDVPLVAPSRALDVDRKRQLMPDVVGDAAGN